MELDLALMDLRGAIDIMQADLAGDVEVRNPEELLRVVITAFTTLDIAAMRGEQPAEWLAARDARARRTQEMQRSYRHAAPRVNRRALDQYAVPAPLPKRIPGATGR